MATTKLHLEFRIYSDQDWENLNVLVKEITNIAAEFGIRTVTDEVIDNRPEAIESSWHKPVPKPSPKLKKQPFKRK